MENLPDEIVHNIAVNLNIEDTINLCQTNKKLAQICGDEYLWKLKSEMDFNYPKKYFSIDPFDRYQQISRISKNKYNIASIYVLLETLDTPILKHILPSLDLDILHLGYIIKLQRYDLFYFIYNNPQIYSKIIFDLDFGGGYENIDIDIAIDDLELELYPLVVAINTLNVNLLKLLLKDKRYDINYQNGEPFDAAINQYNYDENENKKHDIDDIMMVLIKDPRLSLTGRNLEYILNYIILIDNPIILKTILNKIPNNYDLTELYYLAASNDNENLIELLVDDPRVNRQYF